MTIWILAILLLGALALAGYNQGAIRAAISSAGLLIASLLAMPLGALLRPVLMKVGIENPVSAWFLAPVVVFVLVLVAFKLAALAVHRKVDVFYKYKAGDLKQALWERLNQRLGLCVGVFNGTIYLVLITMVAYVLSHLTVQMATSEDDPRTVRLVNRLGHDLQSTGFARTAAAIDPMPDDYYHVADITGTVYHNPIVLSRLTRYPAFLALGERPEFQDLANDTDYLEMWHRQVPIAEMLSHPKTQGILNNPGLVTEISDLIQNDLEDLRTFVESGLSPKYDKERILGRWTFDVNGVIGVIKNSNPNISSGELLRLRKMMNAVFARTSFIATTDNQSILKGLPQLRFSGPITPDMTPKKMEGQWKNTGGNDYQLTFTQNGKTEQLKAVASEEKLTITGDGIALVFVRES